MRALIALARISSSRSSSCCADGWTSSVGGTAKVAVLDSFGEDSASPRISFTLFSMSFWRSSIGPSPLLTILSGTSGLSSSLHGPSMSLSYASALILRTSLSSPLPVTQNSQNWGVQISIKNNCLSFCKSFSLHKNPVLPSSDLEHRKRSSIN